MNIAVLGGGLTGLTAAHDLQKKGHKVTLFEKNKRLGGLASGFKEPGWEWYLEHTYHHIFTTDTDILSFARETGFNKFYFKEPVTASLYKDAHNNYRTIPVDTPQDFLRFPLLPLGTKLKGAVALAFLKVSPFLSIYEKYTCEKFLKKTMGEDGWRVLWEQLFRKKFGNYAEKIVSSFIWARIHKRTRKLGYVEGGFQVFIDHLAQVNRKRGVVIKTDTGIVHINTTKTGKIGLTIDQNGQRTVRLFDRIISTLPTPVFVEVAGDLFDKEYTDRLRKIRYLDAVNLILQTDSPLLTNTYWLNICDPEIPIMGIVQHTNFVDRSHYLNKHIVYLANYVERSSRLMRMNTQELLTYYLPHIQKINSHVSVKKAFLFRSQYAQPIFNTEFIQNKPAFITPAEHIFIANLDMTYPYDRGTNYAVQLGRRVASLV